MQKRTVQISAVQGILLIFSAMIPWAILFVPFLVVGFAGRNSWISALIAVAYGLVVVAVVARLGMRFRGQAIAQYAPILLGRPLGTAVGAAYAWWTLSIAAVFVRGFSELVQSTILPQTPISVIVGVMVLATGFAIRGGLEVIARTNEIILPVFFMAMILLIALSASQIEFAQLQPYLPRDYGGVVRGGLLAAGFYAEAALGVILVVPFLKNPNQGGRVLAIPTIVTGLLMGVMTLWYVGVMGVNAAANRPFLVIDVARMIDIGGFLQNLDAVFISFWVLINFAKLSVWYYATSISAAQVLQLKDYRALTWPIGILVGELAILSFDSQTDFFTFVLHATPYLVLFELVIPSLLLLVAYIRSR